jgi:hypothetical protein
MTRMLAAGLALALVAAMPAAGAAQETERYVYVTVLGSDGAPLARADGGSLRHPRERAGSPRRARRAAGYPDARRRAGRYQRPAGGARRGVPQRRRGVRHAPGGSPPRGPLFVRRPRGASVLGFTQEADRLRGRRRACSAARTSGHSSSTPSTARSRDLAGTEAKRPVIIAIASESPESSSRTAGGVIRKIADQSVAFHVVSVASATGSSSRDDAQQRHPDEQPAGRHGVGRRRRPRADADGRAGNSRHRRRPAAGHEHARTRAGAGARPARLPDRAAGRCGISRWECSWRGSRSGQPRRRTGRGRTPKRESERMRGRAQGSRATAQRVFESRNR